MARWYGSTTERALGADHVADLKRLKATLRDGEPCWRCGQPMYKTQALERDHIIDRVHGGANGPAVLAHASCNRSAGATMGNQLRGFTPAVVRTGQSVTCRTCGKSYHYAARSCEICGLHYHPSYGEQRTCGRVCGMELRRRAGNLSRPQPQRRKPRPLCKTCGQPCAAIGATYCSPACRTDGKQAWPSSRIHVYTCRYCGRPGVTHGAGGRPREVCEARECQLLRRTANNLIARNGVSRADADDEARRLLQQMKNGEHAPTDGRGLLWSEMRQARRW